jgi:hypothetical protein
VFLADRARELSWFTGRKTYKLILSAKELPDSNASQEVLKLASKSSAEYLIIDGYTMVHWKTLRYLYNADINEGEILILNITSLLNVNVTNKPSVASLRLVAETEPNDWGSYARIFRFIQANFTKTGTEDMLESGWGATNNGLLTNASGHAKLVIGNNSEYTNTWRPCGFDIARHVSNGVIEIIFNNMTAAVVRIEMWDSSGNLLSYANQLSSNVYCSVLGNIVLGDIRIVIHGNPGESVSIKEIAYWS